MKVLTGFLMTWGMFCSIPCPFKKWDEGARKWMVATLPVLGFFIGILWFGLYLLMEMLVVPPLLSAALMTVFPFFITGHMHLDGFMDCNDAILSRRPLEEKQKILKDSHVGAFAAISLAVMFIIFLGAVFDILQEERMEKIAIFIMIPVLTRTLSALDVLRKEPIASSQYVETFEGKIKPYMPIMSINMIITWAVVLAISYYMGVIRPLLFISMCIAPFVVSGFAGAYGRKQLGGMSGDISGYSIVCGELAGVIALAVL